MRYRLFLSFLFAILPATAVEADSASVDLYTVELQRKVKLSLPTSAPTREAQQKFQSLASAEQLMFLQRRQAFLTNVARTLAGPRLTGAWTFGLGSTAAPYVSPRRWFAPVLKALNWLVAPADYLANPSEKIQEQLEQASELDAINLIPESLPSAKLTRRGLQIIRAVLGAVDRKLWEDSHRLATTTHYATSFMAGPSLGVAVGKYGFYRMIGLEFEFGADFATKQGYAQVHPISQKLTRAIYVIESHFVMGGHVKFTEREQGQLVGDGREEALLVPPIFSYRHSDASLGFGILSGFNLIDTAALGMMFFYHNYALWGTVWTVAKGLSLTSMFWTDLRTYNKISLPWSRWTDPDLLEAREVVVRELDQNFARLAALSEQTQQRACENAFQ